MFDLSLKEVFFKVKESRGDKVVELTHYFRPPTTDDWLNYFRGTSQLGLSKGRDTVELSVSGQEKDEALWDTLILKVEGYNIKGKNLMEFEDWKDKVWLPHKLNAVSGFMYFYRTNIGEAAEASGLDLSETEITLSFLALQFKDTQTVTHVFRSPESSDYLKYTKATARMQLVRTKQRGVSEIKVPSNIQVMVDLYNKLIKSVDGYSYDGKNVMESPDWVGKIDIYHKREAVRELLGASLQEEEEG